MSTVHSQSRDELKKRLDLTTRALRGLGATLLIASASTFLIQRWDSGNDLLRFGFLLAHTVVLLAAAFFCGGKLEESRSARLFLWTSVALVPVHFGVLGGLLYSVFAWDAPSETLPLYAVWRAPSVSSALLAAAVAFAIVTPATYVATRVLTRKHARLVTASLLGLSSLLLVPVRGADWVGLAALAGALCALYLEKTRFSQDYTMKTWEGRLVRIVLWVPLVMVTARTAVYYPTSDLFLGLLILAAGICGEVFARGFEKTSRVVPIFEWGCGLTIACGAIYVAEGLHLLDALGTPMLLIASAGLLAAAFFSRVAKTGLEGLAAIVAFFVSAASMLLEGHIGHAALSILVGILGLTHAILMGRPMIGAASAALTLGGICFAFDRAIGFESLANWGTLSVLGLAVVVGAAYVERHRNAVLSWIAARLSSTEAG